ncbi:MAG: Hsp20/alpha crystallin family protein [candidate division WOR-3 bacterium]
MSKTPAIFEPFRDIFSLREDMERIFDSMLGRFPAERHDYIWSPLMDVEETADALIVRAELPGMKKDEIKISVTGDKLTISGERKREVETKNKSYHRIERAYGRFARAINLPVDVEADKTTATYKAGILELILPKSAKAKAREIEIKTED